MVRYLENHWELGVHIFRICLFSWLLTVEKKWWKSKRCGLKILIFLDDLTWIYPLVTKCSLFLVFVYADDLIILSPTLTALKYLIHLCEIYGCEYELLFNPDKCYLLIFVQRASQSHVDLSNIVILLCGERVKVVSYEIHLGHILSTNNSLIDITDAINDIKARSVTIVNNFPQNVGLDFR